MRQNGAKHERTRPPTHALVDAARPGGSSRARHSFSSPVLRPVTYGLVSRSGVGRHRINCDQACGISRSPVRPVPPSTEAVGAYLSELEPRAYVPELACQTLSAARAVAP